MSNIINKVPHPVNILDEEGRIIKMFPKSMGMARLQQKTVRVGFIGEVPLSRTTFGPPTDLPLQSQGTFFIVSHLVKSALPHRTDLLVPSELVKDSSGQIMGCLSLDQ